MLLLASALVILVVLVGLVLGMPAIYGWNVFQRFRGKRTVVCPETRAGATVKIDAAETVTNALHGEPRVRLAACSRWPSRRGCAQECVVQILDEPVGEDRGFGIFPVLLAAVVTWAFLGTLGYSSLVRGWIVEIGVPAQVVQQGYELVFPALVPLVIAIGLGFLIDRALRRNRRSLPLAAGIGAAIGLAMSAVALPLLPHPSPILWVYMAFAVLASALMGAFFSLWKTVIGRH